MRGATFLAHALAKGLEGASLGLDDRARRKKREEDYERSALAQTLARERLDLEQKKHVLRRDEYMERMARGGKPEWTDSSVKSMFSEGEKLVAALDEIDKEIMKVRDNMYYTEDPESTKAFTDRLAALETRKKDAGAVYDDHMNDLGAAYDELKGLNSISPRYLSRMERMLKARAKKEEKPEEKPKKKGPTSMLDMFSGPGDRTSSFLAPAPGGEGIFRNQGAITPQVQPYPESRAVENVSNIQTGHEAATGQVDPGKERLFNPVQGRDFSAAAFEMQKKLGRPLTGEERKALYEWTMGGERPGDLAKPDPRESEVVVDKFTVADIIRLNEEAKRGNQDAVEMLKYLSAKRKGYAER